MTRPFRRLPALGWPGIRPSRAVVALGLGVALALPLIPAAVAQSRRVPTAQSPLQVAGRLYNEGKYDEVVSTLQQAPTKDPATAALIGRALIARGKYQEAEAALRPLAEAAPTSEAALELALHQQKFGRADAVPMLRRLANTASVANTPQELSRAARALRALGASQEASDVYRDAAGPGQRDPVINTAWGEVFLDRRTSTSKRDALKSFRMAIEAAPNYVPALIGQARALEDDNPPEAIKSIEASLAINPNSVEAQLFLAAKSLESGKRDDAKAAVAKALEVNPHSLEARSLLAAAAAVEDRPADFDSEVKQVLAIAPKYGEIYRVAGELLAANYRFAEAAALVKRGLALDPDNARALSDLGTHLLRTGDEAEARAALEKSFDIDGYDIITKNLLDMMDRLDTYATIKDDNLIVKMHKDEAPLMSEYVVALAKEAMTTLSARYGNVRIEGPVLVELFSKHDDFAVRNVGLPGMVGALGACFGRVVTMDSPRAAPPGDFMWESTLWHEIAHVVTLQLSKQRVPRWLTEGVSVYEQALRRPEWARGQDVSFAEMMNDGAVLKLKDINSGFLDARTISMVYFQASLLVEHLIATHGDAGIQKLLAAYADGLDTDAALKRALNTDFDALQVTFDAFLEKRFGAMRQALAPPEKGTDLQRMTVPALKEYVAAHPTSFPAHMMLATALRKSGAQDEAIPVLEKAATLVPLATGPSSPNGQIAQIAMIKKDMPRAIAALREVIRYDFDNLAAARELAGLLKETGVTEEQQLVPVYQRIVALDPFDVEAHEALGRFAMQRTEFDAASREFRAVLALNPVDRAAAHTDLAESYLRGGKRADARKQTLAALEIAPSYERAQDLLLSLAEDRR